MIYLYVKTHNKTGLKYLGKTVRDPFVYTGSGKRWLNHIAKYGYDCNTQILLASSCKKEISETGMFFSELWNIVESNAWANLIPESGEGGDTSKYIDYSNIDYSHLKNSSTHTRNTLPATTAAKSVTAIANKRKTFVIINHQRGKKNSQFGTMWITNGQENKKIKKDVDIIPERWYKGRI
jgi:hypothetical protein